MFPIVVSSLDVDFVRRPSPSYSNARRWVPIVGAMRVLTCTFVSRSAVSYDIAMTLLRASVTCVRLLAAS